MNTNGENGRQLTRITPKEIQWTEHDDKGVQERIKKQHLLDLLETNASTLAASNAITFGAEGARAESARIAQKHQAETNSIKMDLANNRGLAKFVEKLKNSKLNINTESLENPENLFKAFRLQFGLQLLESNLGVQIPDFLRKSINSYPISEDVSKRIGQFLRFHVNSKSKLAELSGIRLDQLTSGGNDRNILQNVISNLESKELPIYFEIDGRRLKSLIDSGNVQELASAILLKESQSRSVFEEIEYARSNPEEYAKYVTAYSPIINSLKSFTPEKLVSQFDGIVQMGARSFTWGGQWARRNVSWIPRADYLLNRFGVPSTTDTIVAYKDFFKTLDLLNVKSLEESEITSRIVEYIGSKKSNIDSQILKGWENISGALPGQLKNELNSLGQVDEQTILQSPYLSRVFNSLKKHTQTAKGLNTLYFGDKNPEAVLGSDDVKKDIETIAGMFKKVKSKNGEIATAVTVGDARKVAVGPITLMRNLIQFGWSRSLDAAKPATGFVQQIPIVGPVVGTIFSGVGMSVDTTNSLLALMNGLFAQGVPVADIRKQVVLEVARLTELDNRVESSWKSMSSWKANLARVLTGSEVIALSFASKKGEKNGAVSITGETFTQLMQQLVSMEAQEKANGGPKIIESEGDLDDIIAQERNKIKFFAGAIVENTNFKGESTGVNWLRSAKAISDRLTKSAVMGTTIGIQGAAINFVTSNIMADLQIADDTFNAGRGQQAVETAKAKFEEFGKNVALGAMNTVFGGESASGKTPTVTIKPDDIGQNIASFKKDSSVIINYRDSSGEIKSFLIQTIGTKNSKGTIVEASSNDILAGIKSIIPSGGKLESIDITLVKTTLRDNGGNNTTSTTYNLTPVDRIKIARNVGSLNSTEDIMIQLNTAKQNLKNPGIDPVIQAKSKYLVCELEARLKLLQTLKATSPQTQEIKNSQQHTVKNTPASQTIDNSKILKTPEDLKSVVENPRYKQPVQTLTTPVFKVDPRGGAINITVPVQTTRDVDIAWQSGRVLDIKVNRENSTVIGQSTDGKFNILKVNATGGDYYVQQRISDNQIQSLTNQIEIYQNVDTKNGVVEVPFSEKAKLAIRSGQKITPNIQVENIQNAVKEGIVKPVDVPALNMVVSLDRVTGPSTKESALSLLNSLKMGKDGFEMPLSEYLCKAGMFVISGNPEMNRIKGGDGAVALMFDILFNPNSKFSSAEKGQILIALRTIFRDHTSLGSSDTTTIELAMVAFKLQKAGIDLDKGYGIEEVTKISNNITINEVAAFQKNILNVERVKLVQRMLDLINGNLDYARSHPGTFGTGSNRGMIGENAFLKIAIRIVNTDPSKLTENAFLKVKEAYDFIVRWNPNVPDLPHFESFFQQIDKGAQKRTQERLRVANARGFESGENTKHNTVKNPEAVETISFNLKRAAISTAIMNLFGGGGVALAFDTSETSTLFASNAYTENNLRVFINKWRNGEIAGAYYDKANPEYSGLTIQDPLLNKILNIGLGRIAGKLGIPGYGFGGEVTTKGVGGYRGSVLPPLESLSGDERLVIALVEKMQNDPNFIREIDLIGKVYADPNFITAYNRWLAKGGSRFDFHYTIKIGDKTVEATPILIEKLISYEQANVYFSAKIENKGGNPNTKVNETKIGISKLTPNGSSINLDQYQKSLEQLANKEASRSFGEYRKKLDSAVKELTRAIRNTTDRSPKGVTTAFLKHKGMDANAIISQLSLVRQGPNKSIVFPNGVRMTNGTASFFGMANSVVVLWENKNSGGTAFLSGAEKMVLVERPIGTAGDGKVIYERYAIAEHCTYNIIPVIPEGSVNPVDIKKSTPVGAKVTVGFDVPKFQTNNSDVPAAVGTNLKETTVSNLIGGYNNISQASILTQEQSFVGARQIIEPALKAKMSLQDFTKNIKNYKIGDFDLHSLYKASIEEPKINKIMLGKAQAKLEMTTVSYERKSNGTFDISGGRSSSYSRKIEILQGGGFTKVENTIDSNGDEFENYVRYKGGKIERESVRVNVHLNVSSTNKEEMTVLVGGKEYMLIDGRFYRVEVMGLVTQETQSSSQASVNINQQRETENRTDEYENTRKNIPKPPTAVIPNPLNNTVPVNPALVVPTEVTTPPNPSAGSSDPKSGINSDQTPDFENPGTGSNVINPNPLVPNIPSTNPLNVQTQLPTGVEGSASNVSGSTTAVNPNINVNVAGGTGSGAVNNATSATTQTVAQPVVTVGDNLGKVVAPINNINP